MLRCDLGMTTKLDELLKIELLGFAISSMPWKPSANVHMMLESQHKEQPWAIDGIGRTIAIISLLKWTDTGSAGQRFWHARICEAGLFTVEQVLRNHIAGAAVHFVQLKYAYHYSKRLELLQRCGFAVLDVLMVLARSSTPYDSL